MMIFPEQYQFRHFMVLFIPLLITQIALIGSSVFSSIFSGQAGTVDLAGVAVGVNLWYPVFASMNGMFYGVTPIIAQLRGARKSETIPIYIHESLYLALLFGIIIIGLGYLIVPVILQMMHLETAVFHIAKGYLQALSYGVIPLFLVATLRNILDAHGKTHISMILLLTGLGITILLFRVCIFGWAFIPPMGGIGTAYALTIAAWITLLLFVVVFHCCDPFHSYQVWQHWHSLQISYCIEQLRLGIPIAVAIFCETSLFSIVGLLMSEFGTVYLAANQAAISYSTLVYTVPWAISLTATIIIGYEIGAKNPEKARQYAVLSQMTAVIFVCCTALITYLLLNPISYMFTQDPQTFICIRTFITYAIFFSFCDAMGAPVQGILRGYKDVKCITYIAVTMYWIVCLPLGYALAHGTSQGAYGYWLGYIIGLALAAILYNIRLWHFTAWK